jgi:uncharacterized membrane protein YhaH (DUF805 family)
MLRSRRRRAGKFLQEKAHMTFGQAVQSALSNYASFSGRARRSEYWWFALFNLIVSIIASIIDAIIGTPILALIIGLALLLPGLGLSFRRLHDTGRAGWWILIALIPLIGWIVLLVFFCQDSQPGPNQYGPNPKGGDAAPYGYGTHQ